MVFLLSMWRYFVLIPTWLHETKWGYTIIILVIMTMHLDHMNQTMLIVSQRIELRMDIVTPAELDIMENLCIYDVNPIKAYLYDRENICTKEVKEFFYERVDNSNP